MAGLEKLTIIAYSNDKFQGTGFREVEVLINPDKYTHSYKICYTDPKVPGSPGASPKFNRVDADTVKFELVFDGTGIVGNKVPGITIGETDNVELQIEEFRKTVFAFNSKLHRPNYLQLSWGTMVFDCQLTAMDISYTLFRPDGAPLRAKVAATFKGYDSPEVLVRAAKLKSPDLTHVLKVKEGDTLPGMCYKIYGDSSWYMQVAQKNKLTDFRNLAPDTDIVFPPVKK